MAKKSIVARNERRIEKSKRYAAYRKELREKVSNTKLSDDERYDAHLRLQKLPRDTSFSRAVSRCFVTGRGRGTLKKFGLSRIMFREMASRGKLPGVTKASW